MLHAHNTCQMSHTTHRQAAHFHLEMHVPPATDSTHWKPALEHGTTTVHSLETWKWTWTSKAGLPQTSHPCPSAAPQRRRMGQGPSVSHPASAVDAWRQHGNSIATASRVLSRKVEHQAQRHAHHQSDGQDDVDIPSDEGWAPPRSSALWCGSSSLDVDSSCLDPRRRKSSRTDHTVTAGRHQLHRGALGVCAHRIPAGLPSGAIFARGRYQCGVLTKQLLDWVLELLRD